MQYIRNVAEAGRNAAARMRAMGFHDATAVPGAGVSTVEVFASTAVALVKWNGVVERADIERLLEVRGADFAKSAIFFTAANYSDDALGFAGTAGVNLFMYEPTGEIVPANAYAAALARKHESVSEPIELGPTPAVEPSQPGRPEQRTKWQRFSAFVVAHWRILGAIFFTTSIVVVPFSEEYSVGERVMMTLASVILAPIFWYLHIKHREALKRGR